LAHQEFGGRGVVKLECGLGRLDNPTNDAAHAAWGGGVKGLATRAGANRTDLHIGAMKETGGGAGGMAEDADKIPGRPVFCVGGREELKTRGGSLSSEGTNAAVQAERSTPLPQYFLS